MRFLNTSTGKFVIVKDPREERYAILSHVWTASGEQSYQETLAIQAKCEKLQDADVIPHYSPKVQKACELARGHGFRLVWIDFTCIDQANNTELSEAINSMYQWYKWASVCYAYLETVADPPTRALAKHEETTSRFRDSTWFKRGWTLQELIAPHELLFYGREWQLIGTKQILVHVISQITGIECTVLLDERELTRVSIAQRMSWAAGRETTKDEDLAYCLMGLFDVNMTPKYGEGLERAFNRLQKAILKRNPDQSLFAWGQCVPIEEVMTRAMLPSPESIHLLPDSDPYLFARHPKAFGGPVSPPKPVSRMQLARSLRRDDVRTSHEYITSAEGTRMTLPLIHLRINELDLNLQLALLSCTDAQGHCIALVLRPSPEELHSEAMLVGAYLRVLPPHSRTPTLHFTGYPYSEQSPPEYIRLVSLTLDSIDTLGQAIEEDSVVYIHDYPRARQILPQDLYILRNITSQPGSYGFYATPTAWCSSVLSKANYRLENVAPTTQSPEGLYTYVLIGAADEIKVHFGYCKCPVGARDGLLRVRVIHSDVRPAKDISCARMEHVRNWPYHVGSGIVSHAFRLPARSGKHRSLRVSVSLAKGSKDQPESSARSYFIDLQVLSFPLADAALLPVEWRPESHAGGQGNHTPAVPLIAYQLTSSPDNTDVSSVASFHDHSDAASAYEEPHTALTRRYPDGPSTPENRPHTRITTQDELLAAVGRAAPGSPRSVVTRVKSPARANVDPMQHKMRRPQSDPPTSRGRAGSIAVHTERQSRPARHSEDTQRQQSQIMVSDRMEYIKPGTPARDRQATLTPEKGRSRSTDRRTTLTDSNQCNAQTVTSRHDASTKQHRRKTRASSRHVFATTDVPVDDGYTTQLNAVAPHDVTGIPTHEHAQRGNIRYDEIPDEFDTSLPGCNGRGITRKNKGFWRRLMWWKR